MSQEDKPVAAQEPVFAFRRKGQESFCTCNEDRYNELAQKPNLFEVTQLYANAAPCARCTELEAEIMCIHDVLDNKPWRELREAKAKITEQAALIEKMDIENTSCRVRIGTLNAQLTAQADRIKSLEAEAADRESLLKTLADTCTEAERIAIERAGRIDALESECRKLRDALSETEAFCKRKDITIERQSKVIGLCKEAMTWDVGGEPLPTLEVEALASIAELEKGVV